MVGFRIQLWCFHFHTFGFQGDRRPYFAVSAENAKTCSPAAEQADSGGAKPNIAAGMESDAAVGRNEFEIADGNMDACLAGLRLIFEKQFAAGRMDFEGFVARGS